MHVLMDNVMCDILGCDLEEGQRRLVLGGRRLSRGDKTNAAYWATCDLHAQVIPQLAELGRAVTRMADSDSAEQARQQAGICARPHAFLTLTDDVTQACWTSPWNQERDVAEILGHTTERDVQQVREVSMISTKTHTRLLARMLHGLEALEAARLWEMTDDELRNVMLSGGGPGNGSMWIAPTKSAQDLLPDAHFMMSTVLTLGCESNETGRLCALLKFRDDVESQCAQPFDSRLHHALTCKAGLARMRQQRAIAATLTNLLKQSGAQADKERLAPHMNEFETNDNGERVVKEATLYLALNSPLQLCTLWIDVNVRAPFAESTQPVRRRWQPFATMEEEDKMKRYKGKALQW